MKIIIVGGGTAGWISALMISKICNGVHEVCLVESEKIKTIGVGEGSTGFLRGIINNEVWDYGCNEIEFMKYTNSIPKMGILFKDWKSVGTEYMEPIDGPTSTNFLNSYPLLSSYVANNIDISLSSLNGRLIKEKMSSFFLKENSVFHEHNHTHHFDAKLAAEYFEKKCGKNVKKINGEIFDFTLNQNGFVATLLLEDGRSIEGDFFIDASGFSRIFKDKMNVNFIKFDEMTLNSAIPFRIDTESYSNSNFYTVSWAQKYGWMWMIPKLDNIGCGYIFDDNYIDQEGAKKEIEDILKMEIDVIKKISFTAGRLENSWNKNVLSVGLSYQFLEPLEATSIHGTIAQLNNFIFYHLSNSLQETVTKENIESYNHQMNNMVEDFRSFILIHYANNRNDTEFWKNMNISAKNNEKVKRFLEISKSRLLNLHDADGFYGGVSNELYNWVLCEMGNFSNSVAKKEIEKNKRKLEAIKEEQLLCEYIEERNWISCEEFINYLNIKQDI